MKKKTIFILLALIAVSGNALHADNNQVIGEGDVRCHIEGILETDKWGDEIIICDANLNVPKDFEYYNIIKAMDGRFTCDILTDCPRRYIVIMNKQVATGMWSTGFFLTEGDTVRITISDGNNRPEFSFASNGPEGRKHEVMDSIDQARFWKPINDLSYQLYKNPECQKKYFKADYLSAKEDVSSWSKQNQPTKAHRDSVMRVNEYYSANYNERFTPEGLAIYQRIDSLFKEQRQFTLNYYAEHPLLWALYDAKDAIHQIVVDERDENGKYREEYEPLMKLYQNQLCDTYIDHPIHEEISYLLVAVSDLFQSRP